MKKTLLAISLIAGAVGGAHSAVLLSEGFNNISDLTGKGWVQSNQSSPVGRSGWFQGNVGSFPAASGPANSYIGANYQNAATGGTISNWLFTPTIAIGATDTLDFSLRLLGAGFLDTVNVYFSTSGASTNVTDFSLLQTFSSSVDTGWMNESISANASGTGRYAFRYVAANTNVDGNYIGIDSVSVNSVPEPASTALFGIGMLALFLGRRRIAAKQ